jgi:hypothetical protein
MTSCNGCGAEVESTFRFCPWCGRARRIKLTEFFFAHPVIEGAGRRALRVSRYFGEEPDERHVRFSVWSDSGLGETRVEAAVSLEEEEAERMARFLASAGRSPQPDRAS